MCALHNIPILSTVAAGGSAGGAAGAAGAAGSPAGSGSFAGAARSAGSAGTASIIANGGTFFASNDVTFALVHQWHSS